LTSKVTELNSVASSLQERIKQADKVDVECRTLEKALMEKSGEIERIGIENNQLQSQVVQLELARDAL
jgi:hypothetical protein